MWNSFCARALFLFCSAVKCSSHSSIIIICLFAFIEKNFRNCSSFSNFVYSPFYTFKHNLLSFPLVLLCMVELLPGWIIFWLRKTYTLHTHQKQSWKLTMKLSIYDTYARCKRICHWKLPIQFNASALLQEIEWCNWIHSHFRWKHNFNMIRAKDDSLCSCNHQNWMWNLKNARCELHN